MAIKDKGIIQSSKPAPSFNMTKVMNVIREYTPASMKDPVKMMTIILRYLNKLLV